MLTKFILVSLKKLIIILLKESAYPTTFLLRKKFFLKFPGIKGHMCLIMVIRICWRKKFLSWNTRVIDKDILINFVFFLIRKRKCYRPHTWQNWLRKFCLSLFIQYSININSNLFLFSSIEPVYLCQSIYHPFFHVLLLYAYIGINGDVEQIKMDETFD